MRKIFTASVFALCIIFSTTAWAADGVKVAKDNTGNEWYVDSSDVNIEKNSDGEFIFSGYFVEFLSAEGKDEVVNFYRKNGKDVPCLDAIAFCMEIVHFRESGGKVHYALTDMVFYNQNKEIIQGLGYIDGKVDWQPIVEGTLGEKMYQVSRQYAK